MAERAVGARVAANAGAGAPDVPRDESAGLGPRSLAYLIDSVLLFGVCMAFAAAAFLVIFIGSDSGRSTITEGQESAFVAFLLATFPAWFVFNAALTSLRGYTVGQYVIGLRVVTEAGRTPEPLRAAAYWLALHPLLFHPFLALPWALFAILGVTFAESEVLFVFGLAVVFLCLAAPIAALIFMSVDPQRRGIHDRLAGVRVVRV